MIQEKTNSRWRIEAGLVVIPMILVIATGIFGWVSWRTVWLTVTSAIGAVIGGVAAGITAKRFLADTDNSPGIVFGVGAVSAIGTVTLGFIYIFYMKYPIASIGSLSRTVSQSAIFVDFLIAQYVGTSSAYGWVSRWFKSRETN